jgi:ADP-dependent NAD(P)H-hydrate dehydratase / NAD(P)H-hydrate epimerase
MRRLATGAAMRSMDREAIGRLGIPGILLMENAGLAVADAAEAVLRRAGGSRVLVLCGKGNNGGDGFAACRHLLRRGITVDCAAACSRPDVSGDSLTMLRFLEAHGVRVRFAAAPAWLDRLPRPDLVVDALLGTGARGPAGGRIGRAVGWIVQSGLPVVSVDVPSGLDADTGAVPGPCVRADRTVTLAEMKRGLWLYPGRGMAGEVSVADIGIPEAAAAGRTFDAFLVENADVRECLPKRPADGHKGTFGRVLVLAGSTGMTGAAALCSLAALRAGAGLVKLGIPESLNAVLESAAPEVVTLPLPQTAEGSLSLAAEKEILSLAGDWADAVAVGPGLSRHPETAELVRRLVLAGRAPVVLDADGLNAFEGRQDLFRKRRRPLVLTPHAGEMSRLRGLPIGTIEADRIGTVLNACREWGAVVVLKGASSLTADPAGRVLVNPTGNSGMATAGSGDVLTGVIAGLIGQGAEIPAAAWCGVFLHGLAGDIASRATGERALIAGDLLASLGKAFLRLEAED